MHAAIVTFGYPPLAHVSAKRPFYMARELARAGAEVTVVTVDWREPPQRSARTTEESVDEALVSEPVHELRIDPRLRNPGFDPSAIPRTTEPPPAGPVLLRKCRTLLSTLGWGPYPSWAMSALRALEELHRRRPVNVTWAIHGDDSSHEVAARFRRSSGVPWVADFKDPYDLFHRGLAYLPQRLTTDRRLRTASALTETCKAQALSDESAFHLRAEVIWSGYDRLLMNDVPPRRVSDGFVLAHFGHLAAQHEIERIPAAVTALRVLHPALSAHLEIHVFSSDTSGLAAALSRHGVAAHLVRQPFVSEDRAFSLMKGADALLLLPATRFVPSGGSVGVKELEYFASGTPVLVLGKLLAELRPVVDRLPQVVEVETDEAAARTLSKWIESGGPRGPVNADVVAAYDWRYQGQRLRQLLSEVARQTL